MVWSKKDFAEKKEYTEAESITGVKKGRANGLILSLLSQEESVFPLTVMVLNTVTGILSNSLSCPFKKSVTGKIETVVSAEFAVETIFSSELQEAIKNIKPHKRIVNKFFIRKFTNKKKPLQGTKQRLFRNILGNTILKKND